jgi:transposase
MEIAVLGIDIGKNVCSVVGLDDTGAVVLRRRVKRDTLVAWVGKLPACIVAMEARCGPQHLGRLFAANGHDVRLMSPEYVRPYVKAQKNDDHDAEGIAEAATRPTMRFVELKHEAQLDMQTLHRARDRLVSERTSLINQLRAKDKFPPSLWTFAGLHPSVLELFDTKNAKLRMESIRRHSAR